MGKLSNKNRHIIPELSSPSKKNAINNLNHYQDKIIIHKDENK